MRRCTVLFLLVYRRTSPCENARAPCLTCSLLCFYRFERVGVETTVLCGVALCDRERSCKNLSFLQRRYSSGANSNLSPHKRIEKISSKIILVEKTKSKFNLCQTQFGVETDERRTFYEKSKKTEI